MIATLVQFCGFILGIVCTSLAWIILFYIAGKSSSKDTLKSRKLQEEHLEFNKRNYELNLRIYETLKERNNIGERKIEALQNLTEVIHRKR